MPVFLPEEARNLQYLRATSLFLLSAALISCSGPAPQPPKQINIAAPPALTAAPETQPLSPSRWVDSSGSTLIGPELAQGRLLLLGGRRALLTKDGALKTETVPCPEALLAIIEVPDEGGKKVLIGHGSRMIFRFDDPLGAATKLALSEVNIDHIGAGPGMIAVWDYQSYLPRFIDLESAKSKNIPNLPALPMRAIAFRNAKEGAAIFEAAGLAVTQDGGAVWKAVSDTAQGRDALRATGLRGFQDKLQAFVYSNGPSAEIDIAKASLGKMQEPAEPEKEPPLIHWIRVTERDPLEAAAASGVEAGPGTALIASHGLLARVDLSSGGILEMQPFSSGYGLSPCALTKAGTSAWLGCIVSEQEEGFDFIDPFAVFRLPAAGLSLGKPALRRSGEAQLRASPSGGLLLTAPCTPDAEGDVCVRGPTGEWSSLRLKAEPFPSGAGPLADGSVAFLRGLSGDDDTEAAGEGSQRESAAPEEEGEGRRVFRPVIYVMDSSGKEKRRTVLRWNEAPIGILSVQSPIEEDEDQSLRFILSDEEGGVYSVVQPAGREGAAPQRIVGASHARLHGMRGLALGPNNILASVDGGGTWSELDLPKRLRDSISESGTPYFFEEPGIFSVSEVGAKVDWHLRIGWGAAQEAPPIPTSDPKGTLAARPSKPLTGGNVIQCTSSKTTVQATAPLRGSYEISELFPRPKPSAGPKPKSGFGGLSSAPVGRMGMLDTVASLEEVGDKVKEPPKTWTLRWLNSYELGAKPQSWSGPAPKGASQGSLLRMAAGSGKRALFLVRSGGKNWLLRVKAQGGVESLEIDNDRIPSGDIVFGSDSSETIAWSHDNYVVVWRGGETPRIIANVGGRAQRSLGMPNKDGVPILLSFSDIALLGNLTIPPFSKPEKGDAKNPAVQPKAAPPAPLSLDGWVSVPNIIRKDAPTLPACGPKAKGTPFVFNSRLLSLRTDGAAAASPEAVYDVLVGANDSCVRGISIIFQPPRSIPQFQPGAPKSSKTPDPGPITFVRIDFANKKAEGGSRGPKGNVQKMSCSF